MDGTLNSDCTVSNQGEEFWSKDLNNFTPTLHKKCPRSKVKKNQNLVFVGDC